MKVFKRYASVAYDSQNFSILSVESISPPVLENVNAVQLSEIYSAVLTPSGSTEVVDLSSTLLAEIAWALRTYQGDFSNSLQLPLDLLRGFLLVPIQFATLGWYMVNSTQFYTNTTEFALPSDLETTATTVQANYRAMAAPWTVGLFIGAVSILLIWCNWILLYVLCRGAPTPHISSFLEVDVCSKSTAFQGEIIGHTFSEMLREEGLGNIEVKRIAHKLEDKRLRLVGLRNDRGDAHLVLAEIKD